MAGVEIIFTHPTVCVCVFVGTQRTFHVKQLSEAAGAVVVRVEKLDTMQQLLQDEGGRPMGVWHWVTLQLLSVHIVKVVRQTPVASQKMPIPSPNKTNIL